MSLSYSYKPETNSYIIDGGCGDANVIVPDTFNGPQGELNVTEIGASAFANCSTLTSITFGKYITHVGTQAFYFCTLLESVNFPIDSNLISIGDSAFAGCSFSEITLPNTVTSIGGTAFQGCSLLTAINIPPLVTSISAYTFMFAGLTNINIPDTVISIGAFAFRACENLHTVVIGKGVTSIPTASFAGCSNLVNLTIGENINSIGQSAFINCSSLVNLTIPNNVQTINQTAFGDCASLESIIFGNGISFIGNFAFIRNYSLKNIYFLGDAPSLGTDVFFNTPIDKEFYRYSSKNGWEQNAQLQPQEIINKPIEGLKSFGFPNVSTGKISIKKQNLGGGKILAKKLNPVYLKIEIASNAIVQNSLQYNGVGSLQNTYIFFEEYMSQNQKNIYNKMNYITKVNFYITLGNVPNGASPMRLGSIYAVLSHYAVFVGERRCVLINRPGRIPGFSFGNPLNKLNVILDNSANENIFNISPFNLADFQGSYQADGRITVSPHTTPVPYDVNQVTAPLSILNGPVLRYELDNSPLQGSWRFEIITAPQGSVAKLNYCALEIFGTE